MLISKEIPDKIPYRIERKETIVSVEEFVRDCVDVDYFLGLCRQCPNYQKIWTCPSFDFDPLKYWNRYRYLKLISSKMILPESVTDRSWTPEEVRTLWEKTLWIEKKNLMEMLFKMEKENPGSIHLGAGACMLCGIDGCERQYGRLCKHPDKMRYSIEALGGNVTKAAALLGETLEWAEPDKLPHHYLLVCGLLY